MIWLWTRMTKACMFVIYRTKIFYKLGMSAYEDVFMPGCKT